MANLNDVDIEKLLDINSGGLSDNLSIVNEHLTESEFNDNSENDEEINNDEDDSENPLKMRGTYFPVM